MHPSQVAQSTCQDLIAAFAASTSLAITETFFEEAEECESTTSFEQIQWVIAQNGETFYAPTHTITFLPTVIVNQYSNLTPNKASLGTVFEVVSNSAGITLSLRLRHGLV